MTWWRAFVTASLLVLCVGSLLDSFRMDHLQREVDQLKNQAGWGWRNP